MLRIWLLVLRIVSFKSVEVSDLFHLTHVVVFFTSPPTPTQSCARGKYSVESGLTYLSECKFCPLGWHQIIARQTSCAKCVAGQYGDQTGIISALHTDSSEPKCKACPIGYYVDEVAKDSIDNCKSCEIGRYNDIKAVGTYDGCKSCSAGRWVNVKATTANADCTACGPGKYGTETACFSSDGTNQDSSLIYTQRDKLATWFCADSCQQCPLGRYSAQKGASSIAT